MIYSEKERREDFHWFLENYNQIFQQYGHKFIAIQNKKILGVFDNMRMALDIVSNQHPLGTFVVQECNGNESAYTVSIVTVGVIN